MRRLIKEFFRCTDLHHFPFVHDHHLVSKSQCLGLIMCHVNHGVAELLVQFLKFGSELPLHVRINHRQWFIEQDGVDVIAHQTATQRDFLLLIGGQAFGPSLGLGGQIQRVEHVADAFVDLCFIDTSVHQRKSQILLNRHGVVDNRKLKHLGDVALFGCQ